MSNRYSNTESDRQLDRYLEELANRVPRVYEGVFSYRTLKDTLKYFNRTPEFDWSVFQPVLVTIGIVLATLMLFKDSPDGNVGGIASVAAQVSAMLTSVVLVGAVISLLMSFFKIYREVRRVREVPRLRIKGSYKDFKNSAFIKSFLKAKNKAEVEAFLRSDLARKHLASIVYYR